MRCRFQLFTPGFQLNARRTTEELPSYGPDAVTIKGSDPERDFSRLLRGMRVNSREWRAQRTSRRKKSSGAAGFLGLIVLLFVGRARCPGWLWAPSDPNGDLCRAGAGILDDTMGGTGDGRCGAQPVCFDLMRW